MHVSYFPGWYCRIPDFQDSLSKPASQQANKQTKMLLHTNTNLFPTLPKIPKCVSKLAQLDLTLKYFFHHFTPLLIKFPLT